MFDLKEEKRKFFDIIGVIHEVHKYLGPGLNESCYQEAMELQLKNDAIPYQREMTFHPTYRGITLQATFRIDFLCKNDIIVECKSVPEFSPNHRAQLFNYMRLLEKPCGILVNYLPGYAEIERYLYDKETKNILGMDGRIIKNFIDI
ncbi:MAG: GxxExxY protein [Muribaculaceae bacterium]|nr:GxxExxY protein [Muribaculaceae bacterium]